MKAVYAIWQAWWCKCIGLRGSLKGGWEWGARVVGRVPSSHYSVTVISHRTTMTVYYALFTNPVVSTVYGYASDYNKLLHAKRFLNSRNFRGYRPGYEMLFRLFSAILGPECLVDFLFKGFLIIGCVPVVAFFDDCQTTAAFSTKGNLSFMAFIDCLDRARG